MKTKSKINGYIVRSAVYAVFFSVGFIGLSSALNSSNRWQKSAWATGGSDATATIMSQARAFTFAERVAYQRAIENVYWRHRIWPKENPAPKPSLDAVMSQTQLENKVADYLRDSQALEDYWQRPITAEQLQAEMDRISRDTKQPEVLREVFEALGNDPAVIAECLARPVLTERLIGDLPAQEKTRRSESPRTNGLRTLSMATTSGQVAFTLPTIADTGDPQCTNDTWTTMTTINAPPARYYQTTVWTGTEMIVWGGSLVFGVGTNTGGRYNPSTDSWTATSTTNAPGVRSVHTAVWTGTEMIVWGGHDGSSYFNTGGRYNPGADSWTATSTTNAPSGRLFHTAVWTGSEMIVWGGANDVDIFDTGGRYNPGADSWTATSTTNTPGPLAVHTAVWTGSEMIVWGGTPDGINATNTGGRYNPGTDSWIATSTTNAPDPRAVHTAVWIGTEMIVWGGNNGPFFNSGGRYNPSTDSWTATNMTNAPSARDYHSAVWTGTEMIVWGGENGFPSVLNTGGRYSASTDSWTATSMTNAPSGRAIHSAVWTGTKMTIWGGTPDGTNSTNTGGRYCAGPGAPRPTPTPRPRPTPFPRP